MYIKKHMKDNNFLYTTVFFLSNHLLFCIDYLLKKFLTKKIVEIIVTYNNYKLLVSDKNLFIKIN